MPGLAAQPALLNHCTSPIPKLAVTASGMNCTCYLIINACTQRGNSGIRMAPRFSRPTWRDLALNPDVACYIADGVALSVRCPGALADLVLIDAPMTA